METQLLYLRHLRVFFRGLAFQVTMKSFSSFAAVVVALSFLPRGFPGACEDISSERKCKRADACSPVYDTDEVLTYCCTFCYYYCSKTEMTFVGCESSAQCRESSLKFNTPRLNFLFSDSRVVRSKLIILVETKKFLEIFLIFLHFYLFILFYFDILVFGFSDFLISFSSYFFPK